MEDTRTNAFTDHLNWDDVFISLSLAYFQPKKALKLYEKCFSGQWNNGLLPQFDDNKTSGSYQHMRNHLVRPPIHGFLLWRLYETLEDKVLAKAFLKRFYPKVLAFHRFLYQHRDPDEEGLVFTRHPWESGMDYVPIWDTLLQSIDPIELRESQLKAPDKLGPFAVQDPFFNTLLIWSNESLIKAGGILKEDILEVIQWHELAIYSFNDQLWDEERGIYNAYDLNAKRMMPVSSISGLLPMVGEVPTQDQAESLLITLESGMFGGKSSDYYLCPTNSLNAPSMSHYTKWRGSVNMLSNWMLVQGLLRYDMDEMAKKIKEDMLDLFSKHGFYEHYDARKLGFRSIGYGRSEDPVSAAICVDLLLREMVMV